VVYAFPPPGTLAVAHRRFRWGHAWACSRRATCPFGLKQQADLLAMTVPLGAHSEFSSFFFDSRDELMKVKR
jgi:hypothetical protein